MLYFMIIINIVLTLYVSTAFLSHDRDLSEIKVVYAHTRFASYLHLRVGNVGSETTSGSWRGTNALLLGVFQVTLFCPGLRRTADNNDTCDKLSLVTTTLAIIYHKKQQHRS